MATNVHVTSIDALGAFRSRLIIFSSAAARALDEAFAEVSRTRQWIRNDRRFYWEGEIRRRQKKVDQALQELMGARLSSLREATAAQQNAVTKARRDLHEAEEKLRRVKYWDRNYDLTVDPIIKQMGGLRTVLDHNMPKAIALLANAQRALDAYSEKIGAAHAPATDEPVREEEETGPAPENP
jgi:hypothetical protein